MYRFALGLFLLISIFVWNCSSEADINEKPKQDSDTSTQAKANQQVVWYNFDEGLAKAKQENKAVLIDFFTDWCHWCKVMDEKTFKDAKVAEKLNNRFITIRLDAEDNTKKVTYKSQTFTNLELTRAFQVRGFPSLGFLTAQADLITVIPGFIPPETFINILGYIDEECYKKQISFEEYLKKKGECK